MTKTFIGALVGAIIFFIVQFLSWTLLDCHRAAMQYTPKQDSILSYLSSQFDSSGGYIMPNVPKGASNDEHEKAMKDAQGKPWAQVYYHKTQDANMGINMAKNLVCNFIFVLLFCWLLAGYTANSFGKTLFAAVFTGLIVFLQGIYTAHIWYQSFDLYAHFADIMISWILTGIWLGWWLNRARR